MSKKFYITTPIYYVNARPHIGHAYTTIACDTVARRQRMMGYETFFLTGTDEHGQKIERAAQAAGKTPQQLTDEVSAQFRALWDRMGLSYDDFIRTTSDKHKQGVQALWRRIRDNGYIYKGHYTGQYCVFDELYVDSVGPGAPCPECGRPTETVGEENYFFKLSAFQDRLLELYTGQPDFIRPETRRNEVMSFVRSGLRDLSVSRSTFSWGIPVPDDPKHVIYVWWDALANYITALGYGSDDATKYDKYWPADVQMIGKEIVRFHCVYWPAFLMAAGLPVPQKIMAHGWLLFEENKMSKSRGNIVRTETILDVLGQDALRYFLLREVVFGQDGSFSFDALVQRYNADLANNLGNLVSRVLAMQQKYFDGVVQLLSSAWAAEDQELRDKFLHAENELARYMADLQFHRALESIWAAIDQANRYIVQTAPFTLFKDPEKQSRVGEVLHHLLEAIRLLSRLLEPFMPDTGKELRALLRIAETDPAYRAPWGECFGPGHKVDGPKILFPRIESPAGE